MSYSSDLTRKRIMKCAYKEFAAHGYQKANMRGIAQTAKVTTGALYNHFANKEVLFDALVKAPAEEMLTRFKELHQQTAAELPFAVDRTLSAKTDAGTDWMLKYIYKHMDAFRLIFCRSEGTRWASYLEELIEVEERSYRAYCEALGKTASPVDDIFLHVTATAGFQYLVEFVSHDLPYDKAVSVMDSVKRYSLAGWSEILGLRT